MIDEDYKDEAEEIKDTTLRDATVLQVAAALVSKIVKAAVWWAVLRGRSMRRKST